MYITCVNSFFKVCYKSVIAESIAETIVIPQFSRKQLLKPQTRRCGYVFRDLTSQCLKLLCNQSCFPWMTNEACEDMHLIPFYLDYKYAKHAQVTGEVKLMQDGSRLVAQTSLSSMAQCAASHGEHP